jgi:hypothetical protein
MASGIEKSLQEDDENHLPAGSFYFEGMIAFRSRESSNAYSLLRSVWE